MKIRYFNNGSYEYFEHCPFCGSVAVDFDRKRFHCPDCGAVVTFDLPDRKSIDDGPTDADRMIQLWNNRIGRETTADDICVIAQKADNEIMEWYQEHIMSQVWSYIVDSATLGKFECEVPERYIDNPDSYRKLKFDVRQNGDVYIISWGKDIKWDNE